MNRIWNGRAKFLRYLPPKIVEIQNQISIFFSNFVFQATNDIGPSGWSSESELVRTLPASPATGVASVKVTFTEFSLWFSSLNGFATDTHLVSTLPYWVLYGFHSTFLVLPSFTGILQSLYGFPRFLWAIHGFFLVFTGFYRLWKGFTGFYWVLCDSISFYQVLPRFTEFYWVILSFIGFN